MNLGVLYKFLTELYDRRKQKIYIELIGGEPTLDVNILDFAQKINNNENITLGIYTNFSKHFDLYYELAKLGVDLTLTWHSTENDNENKLFVQNADKLLSLRVNQNIDVHVMYEKDHIVESVKAFNILVDKYPYNVELCLLDRDFSNNKIYFLDDKYYTDNELNEYEMLTSKQKYGDNKLIYRATYDDKSEKILTTQEVQNSSDSYDFRLWRCDAGSNYMYIDITGNIYPCYCYCEAKTNVIGNIYNVKDIKFKKTICKYSKCPCVWEAYKERIFND